MSGKKNDNDYENNGSNPISQKEDSDYNNDKPLAKLLVVDDDPDIVQLLKLARKVKEINPSIKVVLITAFEIKDNEFSKVFPSSQVDGFVQKPIGIKDLTNKILSIIGETKRGVDDEDR